MIVSSGGTIVEAARRIGVSEQTFTAGGPSRVAFGVDQARRLKQPETENSRLKRAAAELTLGNRIPKEAAEGNF